DFHVTGVQTCALPIWRGPQQEVPMPSRIDRGDGAMTAGRRRDRLAVGYARRSTDRQEQSILDQKRAIERYAEEQGLKLLRIYVRSEERRVGKSRGTGW